MATLQLPIGVTLACSVVFIPTSTILLGMRFWTRRTQKASIGIDDWLMIPAYLCVLGMQITMIAEICKRMIGYPDPNFKPGVGDASTNLAFWPFELLQVPALGLVKLSVIFLYRRIFNVGLGAFNWNRWSLTAMIAIISAWTVAFFFSFLFICRGDPANYWISVKAEKSFCVATQHLHLGFSVSDTILDCLVLLVVIPMIWNLHMSIRRKLAVTGVFALGLITVAFSITRMAVFVQATALRYDPDLDFEYLDTSAMYWSMLETGFGFLTANVVVAYVWIAHSRFGAMLRSLSTSLTNFARTSDHHDSSSEHPTELDEIPVSSKPGA